MAKVDCVLLFTGMIVHSLLAATTFVDITGSGCDQLNDYYIKNINDIISIYAEPQYNMVATRDHCDVTVRTDEGRRLEYIIESIIFNERGVEIRIYDSLKNDPFKTITCIDNGKVPIQGKTNHTMLRLSVRKSTPESRAFTFSMTIKNDLEDEPMSSAVLALTVVAVLFLFTLLVLVSALLHKYLTRVTRKRRQQRSEEALTRAINIYNSQEPLKESDHMRLDCKLKNKSSRCEPEIAFVHSDGRLERFRLLSSHKREQSPSTRKKASDKSRSQHHFHGPHHNHVEGEEEMYMNFSPLCAKLEPVSAQCLGADHTDTVSLRSCSLPPSYEEALKLPVVAARDSSF